MKNQPRFAAFSLRRRRAGAAGYTLTELVMVAAVLVILATAALPVVKFTNKRFKEAELRSALRSMRFAARTRSTATPVSTSRFADGCFSRTSRTTLP